MGTHDSIEQALSAQSTSSDSSGNEVMVMDTGLDGEPNNIPETFQTGTLPGDGSPAC